MILSKLSDKFCFARHDPENNGVVTSSHLRSQDETGSDFIEL